MLGSSLPLAVCRRAHVCLRYLCLFPNSGVQHILCCVFALYFFVLLLVALDCPFLNATSVVSNFYLQQGQVKLTLLKDMIALTVVYVLVNIEYAVLCIVMYIQFLYKTVFGSSTCIGHELI